MISKAKILIVDDEPINIEVLYDLLNDLYDIRFATNGFKALELARTYHPDVILLDVMMPEMSGYDVCRSLKADEDLKSTLVVFVTAMADENDEKQGLSIGAIDYITKPINPDITRARVKNFVTMKQQHDLLENMALNDALTEIPNRRHFDSCLQIEWRRAIRAEEPIALLVIDIDHFKFYNDTYGHDEGDQCLKTVASVMHQQVERAGDLLARYGGEEFVCLMPHTALAGAITLGERLLSGVADMKIAHAKSPVREYVTLSIGAASVIPTQESSIEAFFKAADEALYKAKESGRNRICSA